MLRCKRMLVALFVFCVFCAPAPSGADEQKAVVKAKKTVIIKTVFIKYKGESVKTRILAPEGTKYSVKNKVFTFDLKEGEELVFEAEKAIPVIFGLYDQKKARQPEDKFRRLMVTEVTPKPGYFINVGTYGIYLRSRK